MKLIQIGAGNIGRSFIGERFASSGFEVVFVDVDTDLIDELNARGSYRVIIKSEHEDREIEVRGVRGIDGRMIDEVAEEIRTAAYIATAVGLQALPKVVPTIAAGLRSRAEAGSPPVDIILAENVRNAAALVRSELDRVTANEAPEIAGYIRDSVGLVETSIGKMVPIMTEEDREVDRLWVFAEAYDTLIVDATAFRGSLPEIPTLKPVDSIDAYVDRKLFIHNLGHAAVAYLGFRSYPDHTFLYEVLEEAEVAQAVREAMEESAAALHAEYGTVLPSDELTEHIDDLLHRFRNRALRDTVHRVGRDLRRKLGKSDRVIGAGLLAVGHGLPVDAISRVAAAALLFRATDEGARLYPGDEEFVRRYGNDVDRVLAEVSELSREDPVESTLKAEILSAYRTMTEVT